MTYKNTTKTAEAKKGPIDEIRVNGCKVAVWENQTEKGIRHNVTFERSYPTPTASGRPQTATGSPICSRTGLP
jgi:hypothetical protein